MAQVGEAPSFPRKTVAALACAVLAVAAWRHALPPAIAWLYAGASVLMLVLYAWDKAAAQRGTWRTRERTLHLVALFGGWPGALLAQDRYRHKTRKASFQWLFWFTVLANCAALALCLNT